MRSETLFISYLLLDYHCDKAYYDYLGLKYKAIILVFALNLGINLSFVELISWVEQKKSMQTKLNYELRDNRLPFSWPLRQLTQSINQFIWH